MSTGYGHKSRPSPNQEFENRDLTGESKRLPTGYEGQNVPDDFFIPECNIEDLDRAIFNLFDKDLEITVEQNNQVEKVPVIFATGERFALVKRRKPLRDKNNALILPLVSIRRTGISQAFGAGHGLGQDTGDIVIKRRLSKKDRRYQKLVNKLALENQSNVNSENNFEGEDKEAKAGRQTSRRNVDYSDHKAAGTVLNNTLGNNIFEIITIPFPRFYTASYEVTFWTQYTQHMNRMMEYFMLSYQAPGNQFRVESDKGYWFVAYIGDDFNPGNNFDDFTDQERIVRYTFNLTANGYLIANQSEGVPNPFRYYLSAPIFRFEISELNNEILRAPSMSPVGTGDPDKFTLSDVTLLDKNGNPIQMRGRSDIMTRAVVKDPFGGKSSKYLRVKSRNQRKGETVLSNTTPSVLSDDPFNGFDIDDE